MERDASADDREHSEGERIRIRKYHWKGNSYYHFRAVDEGNNLVEFDHADEQGVKYGYRSRTEEWGELTPSTQSYVQDQLDRKGWGLHTPTDPNGADTA